MWQVTGEGGATGRSLSPDDQLRAVLDAMPTGVVVVGDDGGSVWWNRACGGLFGDGAAEAGDAEHRSLEEMAVAADRGVVREFCARVAGGEPGGGSELRAIFERFDGRRVTLELSASQTNIDGGSLRMVHLREVGERVAAVGQVSGGPGAGLRRGGATADFSELAHAMDALEEREQFLEATLEAAGSGIAVLDLRGRAISANLNAARITGYSVEEFLELAPEDLFSQSDLALMMTRLDSRMGGEERAEPLVVRARRKDGAEIALDIQGAPLMQSGRLGGLVLDFRDITEELAVRREADETAEHLASLFEAVTTGLVIIGPGRRFVSVNRAFCELSGYSREELEGRPFADVLHPEDLELAVERFERQRRGEPRAPSSRNLRLVRKDGELRDLYLSSKPFVVAGERVGTLSEVRDVTDENALQRLVSASADQVNAILETTPDALVVVDEREVIVRVNAAAEEMFGFAAEDLIGHTVVTLLPDGSDPKIEKRVGREGGGARSATIQAWAADGFGERIGRRADGTEFPAELARAEAGLYDASPMFVIAIRDTTERKQVEEELRRLNRELASQARERRELIQQLLTAHEEERRTVAYEIHDGPAQQLAAAQMFLDAYAFDQSIDLSDGSADHFRRATTYLRSGLSETRRIMSGLRPALLDDVGLADALHELLREQAERTGMELEFDVTGLVDELSPALEITLYRVAQEATSNAVKYAGSDCLRVDLWSDSAVVGLQVKDEGSGFDMDRVGGPQDGHRYGLVGMRERVELLGGRFEIESALGAGTTVTATIPLRDVNG